MVSFSRIAFLSSCACRPTSSYISSQRSSVPTAACTVVSVKAAISASLTSFAWGTESESFSTLSSRFNSCPVDKTNNNYRKQPVPTTGKNTRLYMSTSSNRAMTSSSSSSSATSFDTGFLNAENAAALDEELMSTPGFSVEQLMELAGLSVAEAVYAVIPPTSSTSEAAATDSSNKRHILLVCGPGNNGGDGLVAARHLVMFGYTCTVVYPKRSSKQLFVNLVQQCQDVGVEIVDSIPTTTTTGVRRYDAVVDAVFGFSFKGEPREPFGTIIKQMMELQRNDQRAMLISVDVPSGWNVDDGDVSGLGLMPDVLVSLTAPKLSAMKFTGRHFVGGRFLPPKLGEKYGVRMPPYPGMPQYPGVSQTMEIPINQHKERAEAFDDKEDWAIEYAQYMAQKEAEDLKRHAGENESPSLVDKGTVEGEDWAIQYAQYCAEKERDLAQKDKG